jgi:hypothetical protein
LCYSDCAGRCWRIVVWWRRWHRPERGQVLRTREYVPFSPFFLSCFFVLSVSLLKMN